MPGGSTEERVAALEKKMKEMEALVKGLTEAPRSEVDRHEAEQIFRGKAAGTENDETGRAGRHRKHGNYAEKTGLFAGKGIRTGKRGEEDGHDYAAGRNHETGRTPRG